jgi:predicted nucleic-acid-binding protein
MNQIDTNVIVRFLTADESPKYKGVYNLFKKLESNQERVEIKPLVFFQTFFVLKSFYKVEKEKIAYLMSSILGLSGVFMEKKAVYRRTLEIYEKENLEVVDCYLLACVENDSNAILYSYDKNFDRYGIRCIEP